MVRPDAVGKLRKPGLEVLKKFHSTLSTPAASIASPVQSIWDILPESVLHEYAFTDDDDKYKFDAARKTVVPLVSSNESLRPYPTAQVRPFVLR